VRITRDQMYMEVARVVSKRSTCFRLNVGAVLVADKRRIIGIGYNGPAAGEPHCLGNDCVPKGLTGCQRSLHAEANAIRLAAPEAGQTTIYVTTSPCAQCTQLIINSEISRVVYEGEYRDTGPLQRLVEHGVVVHRLTPSGYLVSFATGEIIPEPA